MSDLISRSQTKFDIKQGLLRGASSRPSWRIGRHPTRVGLVEISPSRRGVVRGNVEIGFMISIFPPPGSIANKFMRRLVFASPPSIRQLLFPKPQVASRFGNTPP